MVEYDFVEDGVPHVIVSEIYYEEKRIAKTIKALTPVKLPKKGTYKGGDLIVCLNSKRLQHIIHYNYDENDPHNSIWMTFDLLPRDVITFRLPPKQ